MGKKQRGLWAQNFDDGYASNSIIAWSFFFIYTLILTLADQVNVFSVSFRHLISYWGMETASDYTASCFGVVIVSVFILICMFVVYSEVPEYKSGIFNFVCFPGRPFYWIWLNLGYIGLHRLFDLAVIIAAVILPWKTVAIILVYMYGVFASLLWTDTCNTTRGANMLRLLVSCVLMAFVCFKNLLVA